MKKSYESPDCKIVVTTTDFDLLQISAEKDDPQHGGEDNLSFLLCHCLLHNQKGLT